MYSLNRLAAFSLFVCLSLGCGGGGDAPPETTVSVAATTDGKPLDGKSFSIVLAPTKKGRPVVVNLDGEGKGKASVAIGECQVSVVANAGGGGHADPKASPVGPAFLSGSSPLTCTVEKGKANDFKFDVGKSAPNATPAGGVGGGHGGPRGGHGGGS